MEIKYDKLPEHMRSGAQLYIERGIPPGGFLTAILEHDLTGAIHRADHINRELIPIYVDWMTWDIPAMAHGSPEIVDTWIEQKGMEGA